MRENPNFRKQLDIAFEKATGVIATTVANEHRDNLASQTGTGVKYPWLPNRSSLSSGNSAVDIGEIPPDAPEFPVVQSGGMIGSVDAKQESGVWHTGYFNANLEQVLKLEFGDFLVSARKGLYETASSEKTIQKVGNELRKL